MDNEETQELPLELPKEAPKEVVPSEETPVEETPVAEASPEAEAPKADAEPEPQPEPEDWRAKEIRRKHAQIKERDRELERIRKENEDLRALAEARSFNTQLTADGATQELPKPPAPQNMTQAQIQEAARLLREQERYQENLVSINSAGEKNYGKEWGKALENLATLGEVEVGTMQGIMATDAPEKVLYELGKNPAEYQRIMDLPPARRQTEFVKLSLKQETPKPKPSNAPAPTEPVQSRVSPSSELSDKDDDDTWYKKRAAMRAARRKERAGV